MSTVDWFRSVSLCYAEVHVFTDFSVCRVGTGGIYYRMSMKMDIHSFNTLLAKSVPLAFSASCVKYTAVEIRLGLWLLLLRLIIFKYMQEKCSECRHTKAVTDTHEEYGNKPNC